MSGACNTPGTLIAISMYIVGFILLCHPLLSNWNVPCSCIVLVSSYSYSTWTDDTVAVSKLPLANYVAPLQPSAVAYSYRSQLHDVIASGLLLNCPDDGSGMWAWCYENISQRRNELAQMLLPSLGMLWNQQRQNWCTLQSDDVMSLEFGPGPKFLLKKNDPPRPNFLVKLVLHPENFGSPRSIQPKQSYLENFAPPFV